MYDTTCTLFLKESLRKTHFDPFSAVSKDLGILQILWNAGRLPPHDTIETYALARKKTQLFGDSNRGAGPRATPPHTLYPLPPLNKKAEAEAEAEALCTRNRRARARQMHFLAQFFAL